MNSFGHNFRITLFGESHSEALGVVMDGVPAGIPLTVADFTGDLARRRAAAPGTTSRRESDTPELVSGVFNGHTTGAPLAVLFCNEDARPEDYALFVDQPRPSHADLVARQKYNGHNDPRGGGHFSGRMTLGLVAAGVVAKKMLGAGRTGKQDLASTEQVKISSEIVELGNAKDPAKFEDIIAAAIKDGDSVGGIIECRAQGASRTGKQDLASAQGVPTGLGEPFFDSVESVVAHLLFSIPGVKGVEFGSGFAGARLRGSENNDPIIDALGTTATNNSGGINGGITNGNPIVVRVAVKPTASIAREQHTFNFRTGRIEPLSIGGRHDACIALRIGVIVEACLAIALADFLRLWRPS